MKIGVYSGSFDPIHKGHIAIIKSLLKMLDRVYLIVSPQNPLKERLSSNPKQRLEDAKKVIEELELKNVVVSDIEFNLAKPNFTINTLKKLQEEEAENEFVLAMGADQLADIRRWRDYQTILKDFGVIAFPRINYELEQIKKSLMSENESYKIHLVNAPLVNISSTEIREKLNKL